MVLQYKVHNNNKKEMPSAYVTVHLDFPQGGKIRVVPQLLKKAHLWYNFCKIPEQRNLNFREMSIYNLIMA